MLLLDASAPVMPLLPAGASTAAVVVVSAGAALVYALTVIQPAIRAWAARAEASADAKRVDHAIATARDPPCSGCAMKAIGAEALNEHMRHAEKLYDAFFGERIDGLDGVIGRQLQMGEAIHQISLHVATLVRDRDERRALEEARRNEAIERLTNPGKDPAK